MEYIIQRIHEEVSEVFDEYGYKYLKELDIGNVIKQVSAEHKMTKDQINKLRCILAEVINSHLNQDFVEFCKNICDLYGIDDSKCNQSKRAYKNLLSHYYIYIYDFLRGDYRLLDFHEFRKKVKSNPYPSRKAKSTCLRALLRLTF